MTAAVPDLDRVLARLDRLERQNRRLKLLITAAVFLLGGVLALAAWRPVPLQAEPSQSRAVEGDKLTLRDEHGHMRAGLAMGKDGPMLTFYDEQGKARAGLGVGRQGTALRFLDINGRALSGISVEQGGLAVGYVDEAGQVHAGSDAIKNVVGFALSDAPPKNLSPAETRPGIRR
jgi:hypothetical protein